MKRKRGGEKIIGRMYNVSPNDVGLFHLRVLMLTVPGATSFVNLKKFEGRLYDTFVEGRQYDTFVEVCKARHLAENDQQWEDTLREAALTHMPKQLRILFASPIRFCNVTEPLRLWDTYNGDLIEDFVHAGDTPFNAKQRALSHIQQLLPKQLTLTLLLSIGIFILKTQ